MVTRSYRDATAAAKAQWTPEVQEFSEQLNAELRAEVTAQAAIGRELASLRTERHLSQKAVATAAHIQQADLSRIERGLGNPTAETLTRIAGALGARLTIVRDTSAA
jgi:XRE family transcriptional regulator, regulator of sulfur utilization